MPNAETKQQRDELAMGEAKGFRVQFHGAMGRICNPGVAAAKLALDN